MTLLPAPRMDIAAWHGKTVTHGPEQICAHPTCLVRTGLEPHHVVRRTATGGPVDHVAISGVILPNVRALCHLHHRQITGGIGGHKAWIRYLSGEGWVWYSPAPMATDSPAAVADKTGNLWLPVGALKGLM